MKNFKLVVLVIVMTFLILQSCFKFKKCLFATQRYKPNEFIQHDEKDESGADFIYYVRPFIPFWSVQNLSFETINSLTSIPKQREGEYPRYVLEKLGRTWITSNPDGKDWFDQNEIFTALKNDLIMKLESKYSLTANSGKEHFKIFYRSPYLPMNNSFSYFSKFLLCQ